MQIAFEIADRALARRVVAEGDVDMGIDQARDRGHAAGVDHDVAGLDLGSVDAVPTLAILPSSHDDGVALRRTARASRRKR